MFETTLSSRMQMALRRVTGKGLLTEEDITLVLKEIRRALLEADVHLTVIKSFTEKVKEQALGIKILKGLNPGQQVVKVVNETLTEVMGSASEGLTYEAQGLTTMMLMGLQGSGKTTAISKLAKWIKEKANKKVLLVAADVQRPAAIEQLHILGQSIQVDVFDQGQIAAIDVVKKAFIYAKEKQFDVMLVDTAGRLSIDTSLMEELQAIQSLIKPTEVLLTIDAMTGQDAANTAKLFHEAVHATGAILTKLDGDTRGGAALSIREVSSIPIKFMSTGETLDTLDVFHPDRMASRILGMGDVLSLVEKASDAVDEDDAKNMMEKLQSGSFNYNDMKKQFKMMNRMGSLSKIAGMIPGLGKQATQIDDKPMKEMSIIIDSMTKEERKNPELIDRSSRRRDRIAKGSGLSVAAVNRLRTAFERQQKMMKQMMQIDPNKLSSMNPNQMMPTIKQKKGKGKHKGRFKY
ncbi:MAG: signal recognition particle protein [Acholeplasmataceae bacterium]